MFSIASISYISGTPKSPGWDEEGRQRYPKAKRLLISADGGGSNGSRVRLWKWELQHLADEIGLAITVCHLPPGTSKWNNTPHRLFAWISQNWRGKPLVDDAIIVKLIAATTTEAGLTVVPTRHQPLSNRAQGLR